MSLESIEWKKFKITELFKVEKSKAYHKVSLKTGKIPYITRTSFNNGLEMLVQNDNFKLNPKNTISLGAENADFFYHALEYITGNNVCCISNPHINRYSGLFIVQALQKSIEGCGFGFANGLTGTRLKNRFVSLPTDPKGNPNWEFMENYMREVERKMLQKALAYYSDKLLEYEGGGGNPPFSQTSPIAQEKRIFIEDGLMKIAQESLKLEKLEWKEFKISELFTEIKRGKRLIEKHRVKGKIPYYSASKEGNGLTDFINNPLFVEKDKLIVTTFCDSYYVSGIFTASDEITMLGSDKLNKYIGLFLANIIRNNAYKFAFGYKAFTERIKRQIIKLPTDPKGNPNWEFMENYMRNLEHKHLEKITAYYEAKLAECKGGG